MRRDRHLLAELNVWDGKVTCAPAARELGYDPFDPVTALT